MLRFVACTFFILFLSPAKLNAEKEQEFFTWVDAQGRIHNTSLKQKKNFKQHSDSLESSTKANQIANEKYLSEEEFEAKQEKQKQESPAFFTWVDTNGQVHNQLLPAYSEEAQSQEARLSERYFDEIFVKPLRLKNTANTDCCVQYISDFSPPLKPKLSYHFTTLKAKPDFIFANESAPGFYFNLGASDRTSRKLDIIQIHSSLKPSVIALDKALKPLHQSHSLKGVIEQENWHQTEQIHFALLLDDADIQYLIWYYPDFYKDKKSLDKLELLLFWKAQSSK